MNLILEIISKEKIITNPNKILSFKKKVAYFDE
jgi:hypothetical protein